MRVYWETSSGNSSLIDKGQGVGGLGAVQRLVVGGFNKMTMANKNGFFTFRLGH